MNIEHIRTLVREIANVIATDKHGTLKREAPKSLLDNGLMTACRSTRIARRRSPR